MSKTAPDSVTALWLVVDCQNDFITGSLACQGSNEAVRWIVETLRRFPFCSVRYSSDWHQPTNHSFIQWGGSWPVHCVQGTEGAALHPLFNTLEAENQRPSERRLYYKGRADSPEEYSAAQATNEHGEGFFENLPEDVWVCGIASEFCVRETVLDLLEEGHLVHLLVPGLGYVQEENHLRTLRELQLRGVRLETEFAGKP